MPKGLSNGLFWFVRAASMNPEGADSGADRIQLSPVASVAPDRPLSLSLSGANRVLVALLLPVVACALQWAFWSHFRPFIWFLFYPAIFTSAWIAGIRGAIPAAVLSAFL